MNDIPSVTVDQLPDPLPDGLVVLDVREPIEWTYGRIDGSLHIPMTELVERVAEIPNEVQVLVVCKVGARSARVAGYLAQSGYEAFNLDGGLLDWAAAGRPLVGDTGDPMVV
jgi:rhodanese-related sulfurtransferase